MVGDFIRFLQIYLCLFSVYFFFDIFWKETVVSSFCNKNLFRTKCLKILTVLNNYCHFCIDVVDITKILLFGV